MNQTLSACSKHCSLNSKSSKLTVKSWKTSCKTPSSVLALKFLYSSEQSLWAFCKEMRCNSIIYNTNPENRWLKEKECKMRVHLYPLLLLIANLKLEINELCEGSHLQKWPISLLWPLTSQQKVNYQLLSNKLG